MIRQVCCHQWIQSAQDQTPHDEAADKSDQSLLPDPPEQHGPDNAQIAVDTDGHHCKDGAVHIGVENEGQETAHFWSQIPLISLELVGDLKGQSSTESHVGKGKIYHEDDGGRLGRGTEEEEPHGQAISHQVNGRDEYVQSRDRDGGARILQKVYRGVV